MESRVLVSLVVLLAVLAISFSAAHTALDPYWDVNGMELGTVYKLPSNAMYEQAVLHDDAGGCFIAWVGPADQSNNFTVYAQRLAKNGDRLWIPLNGVALGTVTGIQPQYLGRRPVAIASDYDGGIVVAWLGWTNGYPDVHAQRIDRDGDVRWAVNGVVVWSNLVNANFDPAIVPDGFGGAIIFGAPTSSNTLFAQRVLPGGSLAWATDTSHGIQITDDVKTSIKSFDAVSDGAHGAYVTWIKTSRQIALRRIKAAVEVDCCPSEQGGQWSYCLPDPNAPYALWSSAKIIVSDASTIRDYPRIISEGVGGVYVAWYNNIGVDEVFPYGALVAIYAQRADSVGDVPATGNWNNSTGVQVSPVFDIARGRSYNALMPGPPQMIPLPNDWGMIFAWQAWHPVSDSEASVDIYAQHLCSNGWTDSGNSWNSPPTQITGVSICQAVGDQSDPSIAIDGKGGAWIAWIDRREGAQAPHSIFVQHVDNTGISLGAPNGESVYTVSGSGFELAGPVIAEGAIVSWQSEQTSNSYALYAQKCESFTTYPFCLDAEDIHIERGFSGFRILDNSTGHSYNGYLECATMHPSTFCFGLPRPWTDPCCKPPNPCYCLGCDSLLKIYSDTYRPRHGSQSLAMETDPMTCSVGDPAIDKQRVWVTLDTLTSFWEGIYIGLSIKIADDSGYPIKCVLLEQRQNYETGIGTAVGVPIGGVSVSLTADNNDQRICIMVPDDEHFWSNACNKNVGGHAHLVFDHHFPQGEWIDLVIGYRADPLGGDGWVRVWWNGVLHDPDETGFSYYGKAGFPMALPPYRPGSIDINQSLALQRFGIYDGAENIKKKILFDEIRVGSSYEDVAPPLGLNVWSPKNEDMWIVGTQQLIRWDTFNGPNAVLGGTIRYSTDGGNTYPNVIAEFADINPGEYLWTIPDIPTSADCKVKVTLYCTNNATLENASGGVFTIKKLRTAWTPNGVLVGNPTGIQQNVRLIPDGLGGSIIVWEDKRNGTDYDIYAQKLGEWGDKLWSAGGVAICTATGDQTEPQVCPDGSGGAVVTWTDRRDGAQTDIVAQRINANGAVQWTQNGKRICGETHDQREPQIAYVGNGNAVITWLDHRFNNQADIYGQKVNASGQPQWSASGKSLSLLSYDQDELRMIADGSGGVFLAFRYYDTTPNGGENIHALRVSGSGTISWSLVLCDANYAQNDPGLVADGANGVIVVWEDNRGSSSDIYAQRVNSSGSVAWQTNGVSICQNGAQQALPRIAADGSGAFIVVWQDNRSGSNNCDIYAQSINLAGELNPNGSWPGDLAVSQGPGRQVNCRIVTAGAGNVIISWEDARDSDYDIYAQEVDATGGALWEANGLPICHTLLDQFSHESCSDATGGALFAWKDMRSGDADVYAQRINLGLGPEEVSLRPGNTPSPSPVNALENNYPNPFNPSTTIEYSVAESGPVNLAIYNVNGQLVRTLVNEVKQKSSYRVMWDGKDDQGAPVASGIYLYKIEAGRFSQAKKLVLLR